MTFNPSYAEQFGRELQRDRMRDAERERLIRQATGWNPSPAKKVFLILRSRWQGSRPRQFPDQKYIAMHRESEKSVSL